MINKDFKNEVINRSIQRYGTRQSLNQTIEELGELIVEVSKNIRGFTNREKVVEELVDVLICFEYLRLIFNISDEEIKVVMSYKLERLNNRLKSGEEDVYSK